MEPTTRTISHIKYELACYQNIFSLDIEVYNIIQGLKILQTLKSDKLKRLSLKAGIDYDITINEDPLYDIVIFTLVITSEDDSDNIKTATLVKKFVEKIKSIEKSLIL